MPTLIALMLRRLACAIGGHRPSEIDAVMLGAANPICRCCGQEVDR